MNKDLLVQALIAHDDSRPRSQQAAIGVSSLGDCRRKVWHMIQGDKSSNTDVLRLPAILGTAIHSMIETALAGGYPDRKPEDQPMLEHRIEIEGLPPATIDYYDPLTGTVIDWKTITLKGVDYFVTQQKRYQVQVYGYLLTQAGFKVNTVKLIGIPRDGTERDVIEHEEPFDHNIALEALAWLEDVRNTTEAPNPERDPVTFCRKYCQFYGDLCAGKGKDLATGNPITDDTVTKAAKRYLEITALEKQLTAEKDAVKLALEGSNGVTFDGLQITWSEVQGRRTPDTEAIEKALGSVPMKQGDPTQRLTVK